MPPETLLPEFPPANNAPDMLGAARFLGLEPADFAHDDMNFGLLMVHVAAMFQYGFRAPSPAPLAIGYGWLSHQLADVVAHEGMLKGFDATQENVAEFVIDQELFWSPNPAERAIARSPVVVCDPVLVSLTSIIYHDSMVTIPEISGPRIIEPEEVRAMAGLWAAALLVKNEIHRLIGDAPGWHLLRRIWWQQWMDVSIRSLVETLPNVLPRPVPTELPAPGDSAPDGSAGAGIASTASAQAGASAALCWRAAKQALASGAVKLIRRRAGRAEMVQAVAADRAKFNAILRAAMAGK
jgi:hypothetical protein